MSYNDLIQVDATLIANEFLDKYMPTANGDYVKVYLYLLRNCTEGIDIETVAEKLEITEGDVRRAIKYWEKCGIVSTRSGVQEETAEAESADDESEEHSAKVLGMDHNRNTAAEAKDEDEELRQSYKKADGRAALDRLSEDADFKQLLFMVQKYRSKILTEQEEQVLAYLYDGLHIPFDVLDYLVQYCVETNHSSMRYIERTGLDWARLGIRTVKEAQKRTREFDRIREEKTAKTTASRSKKGMSGEKTDLDSWLNQYMQRNIQ